jgi:hypothetical protein
MKTDRDGHEKLVVLVCSLLLKVLRHYPMKSRIPLVVQEVQFDHQGIH